MTEPDDVLSRAARELREHEEPGWVQASGSVLRAVRAATRRSWPLDAALPDGALPDGAAPNGDRLQVSDLVVVRLVAHALRRLDGVAPERVRLEVDGHACLGAEVRLVAGYGTDLVATTRAARALVLQTMDDLLGPVPSGTAARVVDLVVEDVTPDDPR